MAFKVNKFFLNELKLFESIIQNAAMSYLWGYRRTYNLKNQPFKIYLFCLICNSIKTISAFNHLDFYYKFHVSLKIKPFLVYI